MAAKTKYVIWVDKKSDWVFDTINKGKAGMYIYRYRANYEYAEGCFKKSDAKKFATASAAENAAKKLVEIYPDFIGYKVREYKTVK